MPKILWIEDEANRLPAMINELKRRGNELVLYGTASEAMVSLGELEVFPSPLILDLFLPPTKFGDVVEQGPQVGLRLLGWIQEKWGKDVDVFVVSGNIDLDVYDQLIDEYGIPADRLFEKPLNEDFDRLRDAVSACAQSKQTAPHTAKPE